MLLLFGGTHQIGKILRSQRLFTLFEDFRFADQYRDISSINMANHFAYQSTQNNANDQVMYTSNRSRSESGSSDSSRGSGNSGNSGKSRRRSHRPRGCRGGSNRRKQKNGEGGNKPFFKKTYNSDFKNRVQGKFSHPSMNQNQHADQSTAEIVTNNNNKKSGNGGYRRGSYNNNPAKDYNIILPDYTYPASGISVSSVADLQRDGEITYGDNLQAHYRNLAPKHMGEPENDYPLLESSYSESSSETIFEQRDAIAQNKRENGILPPPPPDELFNRQTTQILPGPNPYALNSSGSNGSMHSNNNLVYVTHSYAAHTPVPQPTLVRPVSRPPPQSHFINTAPIPTATPCLPGILQQVHNEVDFDYRAQRLEKQRQNVVGGSLFVTSPRSFLMGCKRSFHE